MHDGVLHVKRPEWTSMGDARREQTVDTRRKLQTRLANGKLRFQTYHFLFPGSDTFVKRARKDSNLVRNAGLGFNDPDTVRKG